jgi:arsenate reductase
MTVTIYHNPKCGTSRNVLAILREAGIEPQVIEYLKTPPSRVELKRFVRQMGPGMRMADVLRWKEPLAERLGLSKETSSDDDLLDAMATHPILIERPIVVTDTAVRLCRPAETVRSLL